MTGIEEHRLAVVADRRSECHTRPRGEVRRVQRRSVGGSGVGVEHIVRHVLHIAAEPPYDEDSGDDHDEDGDEQHQADPSRRLRRAGFWSVIGG